jgi:Lon protease-like protein
LLAVVKMAVLPMFPLGTVLLPHMPLSLRIFEKRYLKLLGDLLGEESPEFGVVLISKGPEVGGGDQRFEYGTIAAVTEIGTTDEFYGLQSVGAQRFKVVGWLPDDPYPLADIEFLPELVWQQSLSDLREHVEDKVRKLLAFASEFGDLQYDSDTELSDDPIQACWQLAGILPIGQLDQIDLLKSDSPDQLLNQILEITVRSEQTLRALMAEMPDEDPEL